MRRKEESPRRMIFFVVNSMGKGGSVEKQKVVFFRNETGFMSD